MKTIVYFTNLIIILVILFSFSCQSEERRKDEQIKIVIDNYLTEKDEIISQEIQHKDSIVDFPFDTYIINQAIIVKENINDLSEKIARFIVSSNPTTVTNKIISLDTLNPNYQALLDSVLIENKKKEENFKELSRMVKSYTSKRYNYSLVNLKYKNINYDSIKNDYAIFYFDKDNNLIEKYIFSKKDKDLIMNMIKAIQMKKVPDIGPDIIRMSGIAFPEENKDINKESIKIKVPKFSIVKRENDGSRTRYHIRTPKKYTKEELD